MIGRIVLIFHVCLLVVSTGWAKKHRKLHRQPAHAAPHVDGLLLPQRLVLTFDDGPDLTLTPKVLELLDKHQVKAIFFVNGWHFRDASPSAEKSRELLREMVRRGHFVGNHTVNHLDLCKKKNLPFAEKEILDNAQLIEDATHVAPYFFRTPFGSHCPELFAIFKKLRMEATGWTVDPMDWKHRDRHKNLAAIQQALSHLSKMQRPVIILMHDIHSETVETLPLLFEWLETKPNFSIAHPSELVPKPKIFEDMKAIFQGLPRWYHLMMKSLQVKNPR